MSAQTQRPRRQRKGDRLLNPDATQAQIQCDYAVAPLDRVALEYDRKWGIDRLPELVSTDTAEKYGFSIGKLNAALEANNPEDTKAWAAVCIRGLHAMDAEATRLGAQPASGDYWEYDLDGWKIAVLKDDAEWKTAEAQRPDLSFFTLRQVAVALKEHIEDVPTVRAVQEQFPSAKVVQTRQRPIGKLIDDEIPW